MWIFLILKKVDNLDPYDNSFFNKVNENSFYLTVFNSEVAEKYANLEPCLSYLAALLNKNVYWKIKLWLFNNNNLFTCTWHAKNNRQRI